jgi:hypothetical protein
VSRGTVALVTMDAELGVAHGHLGYSAVALHSFTVVQYVSP